MLLNLLLLLTIFAGTGLVLAAIFSAIVEMIIAYDDRRNPPQDKPFNPPVINRPLNAFVQYR